MTNHSQASWSPRFEPRKWQLSALNTWLKEMRGTASVVTGGGKTFFAFLCIHEFRNRFPNGRVVIVVPTITLLDQWYICLQEDFGVPADEISCFSSQEKPQKPREIALFVINTARDCVSTLAFGRHTLLIVDECHRAGSPENSKALRGNFAATLGLSATPHREYDCGFQDYVVPALGSIIFHYDYNQAYKDGVVSPFELVNVQVDLLPHEQREYNLLTRRAALLLRKVATLNAPTVADDQVKRIFQMRAAVSATAAMRLPVSAKIVEETRGSRTIVFHERIRSAETLFDILKHRNHSVCLYNSSIAPGVRRDNLRLFRRGVFDVLISCRALDEGMNVPETTVAVIASSTASLRQRVQRLGRVLRPARGKSQAVIYTLYATQHERDRLMREAGEFQDIATVKWLVSSHHK